MYYMWINKNLVHQAGDQTKVILICTVKPTIKTVTILPIWHVIIPHIYAPILLIFLSISEEKNSQHSLQVKSKCSGGDVSLLTLSESSRYRPVRTRSVTSNILAQQRRRNGSETWRRRSCQCEHLRLKTLILLMWRIRWARNNANKW